MMSDSDRMCDVSKRIVFVYNAIGFRQEYSIRMIYPLLGVLAGRKIVKNVNEPVWYSTPMVWFVKRRTFFQDNFQRFIASIVESGLLGNFKKTYEIGVEAGLLKKVKKLGGGNVNSFRYSVKIFGGEGIWNDNGFDGLRKATVEDMGAVFKVLVYLIGFCIGVWFWEVFWFSVD